MLKQISIFTENKKGALQKLTGILARGNINILGSVTNDSAEYGIVRMVVSEPEKALELFQARGYMCRMTDVLGVEVQDEVGNLNNLLIEMKESNINVDYVYLSFNRQSGRPIMILHVEEVYEVEACLKNKGFVTL